MAAGPLVFEMAANDLRYELMPFMGGWTTVFASPGTRTTGQAGGRYLLAVRAIWSVTAYGTDDFLIANALKRYALGDRDPLVRNADGWLDLLVQAAPPEGAAPERERLVASSRQDARLLAHHAGLHFPQADRQPSPQAAAQANRLLFGLLHWKPLAGEQVERSA